MVTSLVGSDAWDFESLDDRVDTLVERETLPASEAEARASVGSRRELVIRLFGGAEPAWLREVVRRLEQVLGLTEGWDSYGGRPIKRECARGVVELLARLGREVRAPEVFPASDGGISLEWNTNKGSLEVKIEGADRLSFFAEDPSSGIEMEEENISQPRFILDYLPKVDHLIPRG